MTNFTSWLRDRQSPWDFSRYGRSSNIGLMPFLDELDVMAQDHHTSGRRANLHIKFQDPNDVLLAKLTWPVYHLGVCGHNCQCPQPN
jgi:hypothetical protein